MENDQTEGTRPNRLLCPFDHCHISFRDRASAQLVDIRRPGASASMTRSHLLDSHLDQLSFPKLETVISEETCGLMSSVWWEQIHWGWRAEWSSSTSLHFVNNSLTNSECLSQECFYYCPHNACVPLFSGVFLWMNILFFLHSPNLKTWDPAQDLQSPVLLLVRYCSGLGSGCLHGWILETFGALDTSSLLVKWRNKRDEPQCPNTDPLLWTLKYHLRDLKCHTTTGIHSRLNTTSHLFLLLLLSDIYSAASAWLTSTIFFFVFWGTSLP